MNRFLRSTRTRIGLISAAVLAAALTLPASSRADNPSGCDFAATGTTQSCLPPLSGSTFAGGDGNLLTSPTTFGSTDWQNVAGLNAGFDLSSGTGDNAFGKGTKEDDPNVSVVSGSIPPNKSDLTRFYEASEFSSVKLVRRRLSGPRVTCWSPTTSPTAAAGPRSGYCAG